MLGNRKADQLRPSDDHIQTKYQLPSLKSIDFLPVLSLKAPCPHTTSIRLFVLAAVYCIQTYFGLENRLDTDRNENLLTNEDFCPSASRILLPSFSSMTTHTGTAFRRISLRLNPHTHTRCVHARIHTRTPKMPRKTKTF